MEIGDLVTGGDPSVVGMIIDYGWCYPENGGREKTYKVHWPSYPSWDGWYEDYDLKLISRTEEKTCK